jgi:KTSC domain
MERAISTPIRRKPVSSSSLASIGYDTMTASLDVEFNNGRVYRYFEVPAHAYDRLLTAPSLGAHFNRYIRNSYRFAKL